MAWESHSEKEMIIAKVIFEISRKNDVHNNYETDYKCFKTLLNQISKEKTTFMVHVPESSYIKLQIV